MNPRKLLLAAGVPPEIGDRFVQRFVIFCPVVAWVPLLLTDTYTKAYADRLYIRLVEKLQQTEPSDRHSLLRNARLVLLYVDKGDGNELHLFSQFGLEALVVPFGSPETWQAPLDVKNRKNRAINLLVRDGQVALRHADVLLSIIAREVDDRDNKTCLLLPPRNFGRETSTIRDCVKEASTKRETDAGDEFKRKLRSISDSTKSARTGGRSYFVDEGGIVYQSPPKARLRHGMAPVWNDAGHDTTCVIRGRIRFGASFDPAFHYDCEIGKRANRIFTSCHGAKIPAKGRAHLNISPNDNIR